jgi:hypothetical protein
MVIKMFGLRYTKFQPNDYVLRYKEGRLIQEGPGLAFWFYAPNTSLAVLPIGSIDAPFIFEENSADYQAVTLQGQVVFRLADYRRASQVLNFAVDPKRGTYLSEDSKKLAQRVVSSVKVLAKKRLEQMSLNEALCASEALAKAIQQDILSDANIAYLGIQVISISLLDVLATKETARALEARTREQILQDADDAMYVRRNSSIDQERGIKENEFNTEVSAEKKKRQVAEAKLEAQREYQLKKSEMEEERVIAQIELEKKRGELVELAAQNARIEADAEAYRLSATMAALQDANPLVVQALAGVDMNPEQLIATAFNNIATNAQRVGQLNISPDLLSQLIQPQAALKR